MARALDVASVIAGEAVSGTPAERQADMRAIASVIANRAALLGVTPQEVIANTTEFNAYNKSLPPGVDQGLIDMAQEAVDYVAENGPVNNATFYATPAAAENLPGGLSYETETTGHQFFSDPQQRSIGTSDGFVQPNEFAYAQNPAGVPTPFASSDLTNNSLLSAFQPAAQSEDPFSSILSGEVAPAQTPTVETWSDMAAAKPVQAPMDSVQASGILGGVPAQEAAARAAPMMSLPATADLGATPGLEASTTAGILSNASPAERMGIAEPGFDPGRFDGLGSQVASVDASRFATPAKTDRIGTSETLSDTARMNPLTGAIDPATNTQSFMDQQATPSDLGGFASAMAAQRGLPTGLLSADAQTVQGLAEKQLAEAALSVPAGGILAGNSPLDAQAAVPSLASAYTEPTTMTPAEQAIDSVTTGSTTPGLLSGSLLSSASAPLTSSVTSPDLTGKGILAAQPVVQNAFVDSFPSAVANNTMEPATVNDVVAAPTLDTIQIPDQPSVATIDGPTTTSAVEQQASGGTAGGFPGAPSKSRLSGMFNKGSLMGGILGSMVAGPVGGILGGVIGNKINQNGGLTGLLGNNAYSAPTTQIGGGLANIAGIYGGAYSPGTFSVANNGATITAQPGGYTSYTNKYGVTEAIGPDGKISSVWGGPPSTPSKDASPSNGGYASPGLF